jgi:hypothetical protein
MKMDDKTGVKILIATVLLLALSIIGFALYGMEAEKNAILLKQRYPTYFAGYVDGQKDYAAGRIKIEKRVTTSEDWVTTQPIEDPFTKE